MRKRTFYITLIILLVLVFWMMRSCFLSRSDSGATQRVRPVAVETVSAVRRTVVDSGEFTGTLLPYSRFVVAPKVPGRLEKLLVNLGDLVTNGSLIAVLDNEEYAQQLLQATAELEVSRANLEDAQSVRDAASRECDRMRELREQKISSQAELDRAESAYLAAQAKNEVAKAQIRHKEAAVKAAEVRLSYTRIEAIWDNGKNPRIVAEKFVDEGAMLRASDPIVSIVDLNSVLAVINVVEQDFPKIQIGQRAVVTTDAFPDRVFEGRVIRRAPVLDEATRQARVEIEVPNPDGLLAAGMFIRVKLQFAVYKDVLVVPQSALVNREGKRGIFVVDTQERTAAFVPVEVGISHENLIEIRYPEPVSPIVFLGQHLLEDGSPVIFSSRDDSGDSESAARAGMMRQSDRRNDSN